MTLVQLTNFVRIVEAKSLSKAAALVRIAQPALSRQVRELETEFGAPLLVRHSWGVTPTPAGEMVLDQARRVLHDAAAIKDSVRALAATPTGRVGLGAPSSLARALLPALAGVMRERYPAVRPYLVDGFSAVLHQRTLSGELDLAILYDDRAIGPLITAPLLSENLVLVGPVGDEIDAARPSAALLNAVPLILPGRPNRLRLIVDELLAGPGAPRDPVLEVDSVAATLDMVIRGQGFTVLPYSAVFSEVESGALAATDLHSPRLSRTLLLTRPADRRPTAVTAVVEAELRRLVQANAAAMRWRPLPDVPAS